MKDVLAKYIDDPILHMNTFDMKEPLLFH